MIVNSLIGAVSTLVLFFLQAKLPMAGLNSLALGPALFIMGLGAVAGARMVAYFPQYSYKKLLILSAFGVGCALAAASAIASIGTCSSRTETFSTLL